MTWQTILYFSSILLTCILTGFLAWYAWKHYQVPASRAYMRLTLSECFFALTEIFSVLSPSSTTALFWFQARYLAGAFMGVFWFVFALEYSGRKEWLSKHLMAGLFVIPFVTQVLLWSNSLHGLWMKQEADFTQNGIFWIADLTSRIPGLGYLTHSFYALLLTLAGIVLMFLTAWKMRRELLGQALMLAGAGLIAFTFATNSLFNFLPKTEFNPFTPGIGFSVLLIALSVFRFEFLKRAPADESASLHRLDTQGKYSLAIFVFFFILFTSGIAASSYLTYQNYEKQYLAQVERELSAIAELKMSGILNWRAERMGNAEIIYKDSAFAGLVQKSLENPGDVQAKAQLQTWLDTVRSSYRYDRVFLLDTRGVERVFSPATPEPVAAHLIQGEAAILKTGQVTFLDFHRDSPNSPIHLSLLIPIYAEQDLSRPLGLLVLRIDPKVYLYPYINQWPTVSVTAETLLIRRDGNDILYLNELKFKQDAALNLRIPLDETQVLSVQAVLGQTGIIHGMDYRGMDVIGYAHAIPNSPWFLVARMDTAEVYAPLRERLWQTILFFGALVLVTGAGLLLIWRQQRVNYYRAQAKTAEALRKSEERYRGLIEHASDGIFIADAGGKYLEVNPSGCAMLGYTREEILSKHLSELVAPEDITVAPLRLDELRQGKTVLSERHLIRKDGSLLPVEINGRMLPDGRFQSITRDITERKRAHDALRSSEEKFRLAFDTSPDSVAITRLSDGLFVSVNKGFEQITGYTREQAVGKTSLEINIWKDPQDRRNMVEALRANGEVQNYEAPFLTRTGEIYGLMSAVILELNGEPHILNITRDITERKRAEEALRESEQRLQFVLQGSQLGYWDWNLEINEVKRNERWAEILGYHLSDIEFTVKQWIDFIHPDDQAMAQQSIQNHLEGRTPLHRLEYRMCTKDGQYKWILDQAQVVKRDSNQRPIRMSGTHTDITERKQAEEALRESEERFKSLHNASFGGIAIHDKGVILECNRGLADITGYSVSELTSEMDGLLLIAEKSRNEVVDKITSGYEKPYEAIGLRKNGEEYPLRLEGRNIHYKGKMVRTVEFRDITEQKRAEDALRESEKLFRQVYEYMEVGVARVSLDFHIQSVNEAYCRMLGYTETELVGRHLRDITHPESIEENLRRQSQLAAGEIEHYRMEKRFIHKDGRVVHGILDSSLIRDAQGKPLYFLSSVLDITERKRAEEALRESEDKFKYIFDFSMVGKSITQISGDIQVNKSLCDMLGYSPQEMQNKKWQEITHPDDIELTQNQIGLLTSGEKESARFVKRFIHKNGQVVWVDLNSTIRRDAQRKPLYLMSAVIDITERIQAEASLQQEQQFSKLVIDSLPGIFYLYTYPENRLVLWNKQHETLLGFSDEEMKDRFVMDWHVPQARDLVLKTIEEVMEKGQSSVESPLVAKDGHLIPFFLTGIRFEAQGRLYYMGIGIDITERKQAEDKLAASEVRYRRLFEATRDGILILDAETGMIVDVNPFLIELLGYSHEVFLGKTLWEIGFFKDIAASKENFLELQQQEYIRYEDLPLETADGRRINVEFTSNVFLTNHLKVVQCNIRDITERKQAEKQLFQTLEELKRSNAELEQFAYVASHDLQEPLRAVAGMVQLLQKRYLNQLDERANEYINLAVDGASRMQTLINDLLDYSRIERRGNPTHPSDANMALKAALRNLESAIAENKATVTYDELPTVEADATQLVRLFQNLIGNAIKFQSERPPLIHVGVEKLDDSWRFRVCDNGIGIEPQYFERIFLVFQRLHTHREYPGTGIGLSICKKIVERHGGRIWIESQPGQGSTFYFTIPHRR